MDYWCGKRVRLRALEPGDAEYFTRWNTDADWGRNLDFLWPPQSRAPVEAWIAKETLKKLENDHFFWVITTLAGEPVGEIDTHACNPRNGVFSYGIAIAPEHRGHGYAAEAAWMVLGYYFDELRYQKANIAVHSDNPASIRLHEKLGFTLEGRLRRSVYTHGQYVDELWFGLTAEEYHRLKETAS